MAVAGVLATALTTHAARSKGLFIGGVDVIDEPVTNTVGFGVPIESVRITEAGPNGGVSSMEFMIDDPNTALTLTAGIEVRFMDLLNDVPIFLGFLQGYGVSKGFGDLGVVYQVTCVGIETVLDWAILPSDMVLPADYLLTTNIHSAMQAVVSASVGLGPIRAFAGTAGGTNSTQALPLANEGNSVTSAPVTISAGTTVREAIRIILALVDVPTMKLYFVTVDFYYGLRFWAQNASSVNTVLMPTDYTLMNIDNTAGLYSEALDYQVDGSSAIHQVLVVGTGVSALVIDGSNTMGQVAVVNDTKITTSAGATSAGMAYLNTFLVSVRGTLSRLDFAPTYTVHAGGRLALKDAKVAPSLQNLRIMQIDKSFHAVREDWTVSFGGLQPRASSLIRRLTRDVLS